MTIYDVLHDIQLKLKAPKGQFNSFGKYNYRNCEDILEAVKPLLPEGCILSISDDVVSVGERYYVKASATLCIDGSAISVTGWARESADKKGMDDAQITGSSSSYARKYALNGLFCIDDTKDSDATNDHGRNEKLVTKKVDLVNNEDYNRYREAIPKAQTMTELQDLFSEAYKLAKGDEPARIGLTKLKDERKAQLQLPDETGLRHDGGGSNMPTDISMI